MRSSSGATPVSALVSRHTRELLRKYFKAGKLSTAVATRQVEDRFIPLSPEEGDLYQQVETYISETYNAAAPEARNAVGFVMTIYRRRLASSFHALRQTMEKRKGGVVGFLPQPMKPELMRTWPTKSRQERKSISRRFRRTSAALWRSKRSRRSKRSWTKSSVYPRTRRRVELSKVLNELKGSGYPQVMVFTQFTDTMDYLRDLLVGAGNSVMCFSGRGGEVRSTDGTWT